MSDVHVLIIGAGVTGLLIAHGLKKAGIKFSIFECEPTATHYRPREWSMGVHWALPQLEALLPPDLKARLKEAQNDPFWDPPEHDLLKIYNGLDGSVLKELPIPKTVRFSRRKLRAFCSQGIDIQYGYALTDITYGEDGTGVTATFSNGASAAGTLIIGTDGPRSKVRELLLGLENAAVTPMEIVHSNVAITYHNAEKAKFIRSAHHSFSCMAHPSVFSFIAIQDVPSPSDPANWTFQVVTSWLGTTNLDESVYFDGTARLAQIKEKAAVLAEPFRSAVLWMPDDTKVSYNKIAYWVPVPWDSRGGRVSLAGDAAHPMSPYRGQGLNHAICDASNFVSAVQKVVDRAETLDQAIRVYSEEAVKRGATEVEISRVNTLTMLDWNQLMQSPIMKKSLERADGDK